MSFANKCYSFSKNEVIFQWMYEVVKLAFQMKCWQRNL